MANEFIDLNPARNYTFSSVVKAGNFIYTAHIGGFIDKNGNAIDDIEDQTKQCFETLKARLAVADASLNDVIKINVYLKNADLKKRQENFKKMREIYRGNFEKGKYPVRTALFTEFLDDKCLIQIDAIAYRGTT
ncbi:MAG: RidA family protein [Promethearchaeota archaeon]